MSIKVMTQVWELKMPNNHQLVLLALADHAHDDGSHVFPSVEYVAWKTNYSKRNVQRIMREIEDAGILVKVRDSGYRRAIEYAINIAAGTPKEQFIPVKEVPRSVRPEIHKAFGYTCQHCGGTGDVDNGPDGRLWELDRIIPGSDGGRYTPDNVTLSCGFCNKSRKNKGCHNGTLSAEDKGCHWGQDRVPYDAKKGATGCTLTIIESPIEPSEREGNEDHESDHEQIETSPTPPLIDPNDIQVQVKDGDKPFKKATIPPRYPAVDEIPFTVPAEDEQTAIDIYREIFSGSRPTKHQRATIAAKVTDLNKWRSTLISWSLKGYRSNNFDGILDVYRNGWRDSSNGNQIQARTGGRLIDQAKPDTSGRNEPHNGELTKPADCPDEIWRRMRGQWRTDYVDGDAAERQEIRETVAQLTGVSAV